MADHMRSEVVVDTLNMAGACGDPEANLIHHTTLLLMWQPLLDGGARDSLFGRWACRA
jgi:hypothetical protein